MIQFAALILITTLVLGGLWFTGGAGAMRSLPYELALIGGAGLCTLFLGNSLATAREALAGLGAAFRGPKYQRDDYASLMVLLSGLMRTARQKGFVAIEADIETPATSPLFQAHPRLIADPALTALICDTFRLMALDLSHARRAEAQLDAVIATLYDQKQKAVNALNTLADALPALGIVAAVIGIIRSMGAIDAAPSVLGGLIGSALLGTFLGVFLAYGIVGPLAARFQQIVDDDMRLFETARRVLSAFGEGLQPSAAIELARAALPASVQPDAATLDRSLMSARFAAPRAAASG
jgi:chemotaxis protein MotA